jgi:Tol biopolymer transport system component
VAHELSPVSESRSAAPGTARTTHRSHRLAAALALGSLVWAGAVAALAADAPAGPGTDRPDLPRRHEPAPEERHLGTLLMLTDGAENAEAYFSRDGERLVFQSNREPYGCDQIYVRPVAGGAPRLVSTGAGRTTCAYFAGPDDRYIIYSSTHAADPACPPSPDMSQGYVWAIYESYDIYRLDTVTGELVALTDTPGYDAEATVGPDGETIVFTSVRDGDLDIYTMDLDGDDVRRLTTTPGYDGGPFFSPDGRKICYRSHHPTEPAALADYRRLLAAALVRPSRMEICIMDADGGNQRQVTHLGCASFGPFFHPSGEKIIFSSNHPDPRGREFDLWLVDLDGGNLERVTFAPGFDGFPMWAPDGKTFVFASNRHNSRPRETNIFVTRWRD